MPSTDLFGSSTQQDLLPGGDGAKSYGWSIDDTLYANVADVNITNAGYLTITQEPDYNGYIQGGTENAVRVYQDFSDDFDVSTYIVHNANERFEFAGLIARSSSGNSLCFSVGYDSSHSGNTLELRNTTSSSTVFSYIAGTDSYLRMTRVGDVFTFYSKANSGDGWTQRWQETRSDFATSIQLGPGMQQRALSITEYDYVTKFDYFTLAAAPTIEKSIKAKYDVTQLTGKQVKAFYKVGFSAPVGRMVKSIYGIGFKLPLVKSTTAHYRIVQWVTRELKSLYGIGHKLPVGRQAKAVYHVLNLTTVNLESLYDIGYAVPALKEILTNYHVTQGRLKTVRSLYGVLQPATITGKAYYGIRQPVGKTVWTLYHVRSPELELYDDTDQTLNTMLLLGLLKTGETSTEFIIHLWNDKSGANSTLKMDNVIITVALNGGTYSGGTNPDGQEMIDEKWFEIKSDGVSGSGITDDAQSAFTAIGGDPATGGLAIGSIPNGTARHIHCRVNVPQQVDTAFAVNPKLVIKYKSVT